MATVVRTYYFDGMGSAAETLLVVLLDARQTTRNYTLYGLTVQKLMTQGLTLVGEIDEVIAKVDDIPGVMYG